MSEKYLRLSMLQPIYSAKDPADTRREPKRTSEMPRPDLRNPLKGRPDNPVQVPPEKL